MRNLCLVFILLVTPALTFCQSLPPNPPNCGMYLTCYAVGGGVADNCTACESGYVLAKNSTSGCMSCFGCSPGCQSCQNAGPTKCDTCSQGYTLLPSQTCSPCAANCTKCDVTGSRDCDPDSCQSGFYRQLAGAFNSCVSCPTSFPGCQTCLDYFTCTSCINGYTLNALGAYCEVPTKTSYTGVIISVVFGLLFTIVGTFVAYRQGKKSLSEDKKAEHYSSASVNM
jgi:hypothetical protein